MSYLQWALGAKGCSHDCSQGKKCNCAEQAAHDCPQPAGAKPLLLALNVIELGTKRRAIKGRHYVAVLIVLALALLVGMPMLAGYIGLWMGWV